MRVLVFPGGTECGLEIWRSLHWHRQITLFSAGAAVSSHAPYVFARHFVVPTVDHPEWLKVLNTLIRRERIDFVYPAHDDVLVALAEKRRQIPAKIVTSPLTTCRICRSKSRTYRHLADSIPVPTVYSSPTDVRRFPVFVKPDRGQGSQDTHRVANRAQLEVMLGSDPGRYVITEFLPGEEFTVDCFTDHRGKLLYVAGRKRIRVRNGIAVDTVIVHDPEFQRYARVINRRLRLRGAWFFQLKRNRRGRLILLEVAPRIAGSMAIDRVLGANLPLLSLYAAMGVPVSILTNNIAVEMDRALTNRFRHELTISHVYVDLDDTLVVRAAVNVELVRFLFQCLNSGAKLTLVTRHSANVQKTLRRYRLDGLFDEVRRVSRAESKADAVRSGRGVIFIDDSFSERLAVSRKRRVPTFDGGMIELLLDDRA